MNASRRRLGPVTLGLATLLAALFTGAGAPSLAAQQTVPGVPGQPGPPPRSTTNPYANLRGNSARGLATIGSSRRGISNRATARPMEPVVAVEPVMKKTGTLAPTTPPAPSPPQGRAAPAVRGAARPDARPHAPEDRWRSRLVTLRDGKILRGRARLKDGQWTVHTREGLQHIPADAVRRTALEHELLAEIKKRRRTMDRDDATARLNEARWMLDLGLSTEAVRELDELLLRDDAEAGALALLERPDIPPLVPAPEAQDAAAAMTQLLEYGTRASPAVQELVIMDLVDFGGRHRNELEQLLLDRCGADNPDQRAFGERALQRLFPGRSLGR